VAKLDRLLNLVAALIETNVPMTAEEIRTRIPGYSSESDDAFHRAFERDKDDLRELGVPVETVMVGHHEQPRSAYTIERDRYELPDPGFDADELAALHLATAAVQLEGLDADDATDGLRKLGGVAPVDGAATGPVGALPTPDSLLELFVAVLERREATFDYGDTRRTLQPHRLQFERGRWYLSGYDTLREDQRSFRLDRISGTVTTGEPDAFERPEEVPAVRLRPWELGDDEPTTVLVLLDADIARSVLAEDPGLEVAERRDDGAVVVALTTRSRTSLRNFVLTQLDRAEILEPAEFRDDMVRWLDGFTAAEGADR
jgi:proteasome accessory factor B